MYLKLPPNIENINKINKNELNLNLNCSIHRRAHLQQAHCISHIIERDRWGIFLVANRNQTSATLMGH